MKLKNTFSSLVPFASITITISCIATLTTFVVVFSFSRGKQSLKEEDVEEVEPAPTASPVAADAAKENDAGDADAHLDWTPQINAARGAESPSVRLRFNGQRWT
ncbi:hypothetical protein GWI33_008043 [Rhynchophorus ferrugineus]|uniref:Uncharacterized protein n=1 Tax=Rhynchophorus ferrugineus TaxID=354439 RepID=A0A834IDA7_RHYFE|nr:hypothetical protein GWI33_008043 [Rhynchophorus ferrugineus]